MKALIACLLTFALLAVIVSATMGDALAQPAPGSFVVFHEDWESGGLGWTVLDRSGGPSEFHVSTHYAYDDGTPPNYSYWCGTLEYDANGGYGNGWIEYLELPPIDLSAATNPRLTYRYRTATVQFNDRVFVEVKHEGEYRTIADYYGWSNGWQVQPVTDFEPFDNPLEMRFRFKSNIRHSDDGFHDSDGGAFHVDEIRVYEFGTGVDYFYDDVEDGVGLCSPVDVPPTGVVGRPMELSCRADSDPTTTGWCAPGDTSFVPPNVFFTSVSPPIHVEWAEQCTVRHSTNYCVPYEEDGGDEFMLEVSNDGGTTWFTIAYGNSSAGLDSPGCDIFGPIASAGYNISYVLPAHSILLRLSGLTDDDGIGPGVSGAAGTFTDDIQVVVTSWTAVEDGISWSRIKALYGE